MLPACDPICIFKHANKPGSACLSKYQYILEVSFKQVIKWLKDNDAHVNYALQTDTYIFKMEFRIVYLFLKNGNATS